MSSHQPVISAGSVDSLVAHLIRDTNVGSRLVLPAAVTSGRAIGSPSVGMARRSIPSASFRGPFKHLWNIFILAPIGRISGITRHEIVGDGLDALCETTRASVATPTPTRR